MMPPAPMRIVDVPAGDVRDHDRRRRAGDARHVVVLGQPEAVIAPALGVLREIERILKCQSRRAAVNDGREIENRKWYHPPNNTGRAKRPRSGFGLGRSLLSLLLLLGGDVHHGAHPRMDAALVFLVARFINHF